MFFAKANMKKNHAFKLWHYLVLSAAVGLVPMTGILLSVISISVNKDINFGKQELRGNAFQRPLEKLLDLFPRYQAAAVNAAAGLETARADLTGLQQQIEVQLQELSADYNRELGRALKFNDAELMARKRDNARLAVVCASWDKLKSSPMAVAADGAVTGDLVASIHGTAQLSNNVDNPVRQDNIWFMLAVKTTISF